MQFGIKLWASITKELLILFRDRAGMVLLFVMPAFLVIIITLIQDKVTSATVDVLFVDGDRGAIGDDMRSLFSMGDTIVLVEELAGLPVNAKKAHQLVAKGQYQFAVLVPAGMSLAVKEAARVTVANHLLSENKREPVPEVPQIRVWFDPTVHGSFRAAVRVAVDQVVRSLEARLIVDYTLRLLPEKIGASLPFPMDIPEMEMSARELMPQLFADARLIGVEERFTTAMGFVKQPTAVQQNVPAWAIFGIFFIIVPLAGSLITERDSGTLARLRAMPVSYLTVMLGKLSAYGLICISQFAVIVAVGVYGLPLFGLAAFDPGAQPLLSALVVVSIITAACGYGIVLGTVGRTYEQVAVFGPVSIVIAAAVGGIMVPVYALPDFLRPACQLSPLYWGQSGFYDLLLRGGGLMEILPEIGALLFFGLGGIGGAYFFSGRQRS